MLSLIVSAYLGSTILLLHLLRRWLKHSKFPLPPGPRRLPFVGGLFSFPRQYLWVSFANYKDTYGPISSISIFSQNFIILNDRKTAFDLLDGRSSIYSDRPSLPFARLCDITNIPNLQPYGDMHRAQRKILQQYFGSKNAVARRQPMLEAETRRMLQRALTTPEKIGMHARSFAASIVLKATYGYSIDTNSEQPDPLVYEAEDTVKMMVDSVQPGGWLVDTLPILRYLPEWIPGSGFKQTAQAWRKRTHDFAERPYRFVKEQMAAGTAYPSYISGLLEKAHTDPGKDEEFIFKWSAAGMYGAGSDTTAGLITSFFLAMVLYPEVQRKAQAEIDEVIGPNRMPTFEDRDSLPYVDATFKEVMRWHVVVPMGLPHVVMEDDVYEGYLIPKGSIIMPNIWLFNHDPENYRDPFAFKPERYLGAKPEIDPTDAVFGFGRRVCAGKRLAESTIFTAVAMTLATVNVDKALDANGKDITPVYGNTDGTLSHPKPFSCRVTARSTKAQELIMSGNAEHDTPHSDAEALLAISLDDVVV